MIQCIQAVGCIVLKEKITGMSNEKIKMVLSQKPLGLVFDIDGTLSPIAPTPEEAILYPGVVPLLERAREHAHVAIMTGRAIEDGAAMVNVDGLTYIGTHGLEWSDGLPTLHHVEILPEALAYIEPGNYLLDLVEDTLPEMLANADIVVQDVEGMANLLHKMVELL